MSKTPKISVIMPIYHPGEYLKQSVESILQQSFNDFEFIIVDDTPVDDGSRKIIESFNDKRIIYKKNDNRMGLVGSLNYGISISKGDYIARMDSDDISHKCRFEIQVEFLEKNIDVGLVGTNAYLIDEYGKIIGIRKFGETDAQIKTKLLFNCSFIHPTVMMRREVLTNNMYSEECFCCEDYELWTRLAKRTKMYNIQKELLKYRLLDGGANNSQLDRIKYDDEYYRKHLDVLKIAYHNIFDYFNINESELVDNYADMIFAKRIDQITIKEKKQFIVSYMEKIKQTNKQTDRLLEYVSYNWIKLSKEEFWKITNIKIFVKSILLIICAGFNKLFTKIIMSKDEKELYNEWKE